jgi:hypothetical protein
MPCGLIPEVTSANVVLAMIDLLRSGPGNGFRGRESIVPTFGLGLAALAAL